MALCFGLYFDINGQRHECARCNHRSRQDAVKTYLHDFTDYDFRNAANCIGNDRRFGNKGKHGLGNYRRIVVVNFLYINCDPDYFFVLRKASSVAMAKIHCNSGQI